MKLIPDVSKLILEETTSGKRFSFEKLREIYEAALENEDQLSILIVGVKGDGKTSLAVKIIENLDLQIYPELIIRDLPMFIRVYRAITRQGYRPPYIVVDDAGNIADKWGASGLIHRILYKIYNLDRPFVPLFIHTDTFSLAKHFRELAKLFVVVQKLDYVNSLARFYKPYYDAKSDRVKKRKLGWIIYEHRVPDWLRKSIDEARIDEIDLLLDQLEEEVIARGLWGRPRRRDYYD